MTLSQHVTVMSLSSHLSTACMGCGPMHYMHPPCCKARFPWQCPCVQWDANHHNYNFDHRQGKVFVEWFKVRRQVSASSSMEIKLAQRSCALS